jgi:hypothetical protein
MGGHLEPKVEITGPTLPANCTALEPLDAEVTGVKRPVNGEMRPAASSISFSSSMSTPRICSACLQLLVPL